MKDWADQIAREVQSTLKKQMERGEEKIHIPWIVNAVCNKHMRGLDTKKQDADFWKHCGYRHVRAQVKSAVKRLTDPKKPEQLSAVMPGYKELREYYTFQRDGEDVVLHLNNTWDDEREARAELWEKQIETWGVALDELRRFMNDNPNPRPKDEKQEQAA